MFDTGAFWLYNCYAAMNEFISRPRPTFVISLATKESLSGAMGNTAWSDAVYPTANKSILIPFDLFQPVTIKLVWWFNGRVVSGNVDAGVYDMGGALRGHAGATVQAGVNRPQSVPVNFKLEPGHYQMALVCDNTTGQFMRRATNLTALNPAMGIVQVTNNFPLKENVEGLRNPMGTANILLFGLSTRSFL